MKNKIFYQRNSKGQYVCGLTKAKIGLFTALFIFIVGGFTYSAYARTIQTAVPNSVILENLVTDSNTPRTMDEHCKRSISGSYDCTNTSTRLKVYEYTDGGKKAIKWYGKTVKATVTAYTSRVEETDASPCIAADGSDICARYAKGERICASNDYKLGTMLDIQGLGRCVVSDRMNRRYTGTGRVDWYMGHDLTGARKWGIRQTSISLTQ